MDEELIRQELPIQAIHERGDACTATVPVHLNIFNMPLETRTNLGVISCAKKVVANWYNKDMDYYLEVLRRCNLDLPWLKGYERFKEEWILDGEPDENGFLKLTWRENGNSHCIRYVTVPVVLHNQYTEFGKFCTPEYYEERGWIEIFYGGIGLPEAVNMSPEKMLKYGVKSDVTEFEPKRGIAQVLSNAFCSDYYDNMAKPLLLRDFAVYYLNQLLSIAKTPLRD